MPKMFSLQGSFDDGGVLTAMLVSYGAAQWWAPSGFAFGGETFRGTLGFGYGNVISGAQGAPDFSLKIAAPDSPIGDSTGEMDLFALGDVAGMAVGQSVSLDGTESLVRGSRPPVSRTLVAGTFTRTF